MLFYLNLLQINKEKIFAYIWVKKIHHNNDRDFYPLKEKMKMWYSFYCDHACHLSCSQIAEYIGAPVIFIYLVAIARKVLKTFKRK